MNLNACKGKVEQVNAKMTVTMKADQLQMVIATLRGITDIEQKMKYLRSCVEHTELWEKEMCGVFEVTREGEVAVPARTYKQVVESRRERFGPEKGGR